MSDVPLHTTTTSRRGVALGWFVSFTLILVMSLSLLYSRQVLTDLDKLRSADSDNVQWTLTQAEVEYLTLLHALDSVSEDTADLALVREKFDIFYSRLMTLRNARMFQGLVAHPEFEQALTNLIGFMTDAIPLIDGGDKDLRASLPDLHTQIVQGRDNVRALSISGLTHFAKQSDAQREEIARTLLQLAIATASLLVLLAALSFYFLVINRQTRRHGLALQQANERMHTILATSLDGVIVVDETGTVLEFNRAAEIIFGYVSADVKGRTVGDLLVPDHLVAAHRDGLLRMRAGGERSVIGKGRMKLEAKRANGEVFPIELAVQTAMHDDAEIMIVFIRDVSQRMADEKELVEARDRALAGEKAKADFLTVMSHEIRTPLNGLLGNLSLLSGSGLSPEQQQCVRNMDVSGRILLKHVDSVLDIAKFEAGKLQIARERVNLSELLQNLVDGQSGNAASRGNVIEWCWVGPEQEWVITDAQRVYQILLNLVGNAIKFTEFGRVSIEAEVDCLPRPDTSGRKIIEFRVIDSGIGISEGQTASVFDDFRTNDTSFGRAIGGAGLGLGIARRIVEAMDGEIGVESMEGEGSAFWVRLRMTAAPKPKPRERRPEIQAALPQLDILVVEDNEINLQVARSMLRREGHKVATATDGRSGVEVSETKRFDLIFMDISMPVLDGLQATELIRVGSGPSKTTPIIALSASVLPQDKQRFLDAGMDSFLGKPLTLDALRRALYTVRSGLPAQDDPPADVEAAADVDAGQMAELKTSMGGEVFAKLLQRFVSEADGLVSDLGSNAAGTVDIQSIGKRCHKIAGSAAVFGATTFRAQLNAAEIAAAQGDPTELAPILRDLGPCWERTRAVLTH